MDRDFYLGRWKDGTPGEGAKMNPGRFTTHAVVIGMTGSGKTGHIVNLLEEASLSGIPSLVIDPKGDLANRLLVFPEERPEDFAPFCGEDKAADTALRWAKGLAAWGLTAGDTAALKAAPVKVFTPGASTSPVNVLDRFDPPALNDAEVWGDSALGTVSSLFLLAGLEDDPATSPQGLLLTQLLLTSWGEGRGLTLEGLVQQVLTPPLQRLGIMDLDTVIPAKERTALAMKLNALLASPSLGLWRRGETMDLDAFVGAQAPRGATTIFTLAHLSEGERLFFLGLLLSELSAWTRRQPGSDALRALVVFDEVFGYFPPYPLNPPTKGPLLALLKQARAFGISVVLATQNPIDLDYKGLTNAGLWFLGRLQTEPDRRRVADALGSLPGGSSAAALLADLPPRTFVVHDVKTDHPRLLETRQCMSYLAGPLTAPQLSGLLHHQAPAAAPPLTPEPGLPGKGAARAASSLGRPVVPAGWEAVFAGGTELHPHLEVEAEISYRVKANSPPVFSRLTLAWPLAGATLEGSLAADALPKEGASRMPSPPPGASCFPLPGFFDRLDAAKAGKAAAASLALRQRLDLLRDPVTDALQEPGETAQAFGTRASAQRQAMAAAQSQKQTGGIESKLQKARDKVAKLELELDQDRADASSRTTETVVSAGLGLLGGLFGSRRSVGGAISRTVGKTRMAQRARGEVAQTQAELEAARRDIAQIEAQAETLRQDTARRYGETPFETLTLSPAKSGVQILACRLLWAEPAR